jgi:hypothetical protein
MANRNYSSVARAVTITASVSGSSVSIPVSETTGFPSVPYTLVLDPGRTAEEVITVTAQVGLTLTVARGQDGTTAVPHDAGATARHMATARDFRDAGDHIALTNGVHGVTGSVVGDIDGQVLDNKTFSPLGTDHTAIQIRQGVSQTAPLLVFQEPGGTPVLSYTNNGGVVIQGTQTLRPAIAGATPLTVQGVSGQTSPLLALRDQAGGSLSYIDAAGKFYGNVQGSVTGDISATNVTTTNLTATNATLSSLAPILGRVPFKIRVGSVPAAILPGTTSIVVTEDLSSTGFTQNPYVIATISTNETDADARRVGVEHLVLSGTSSVQFRAFQTAGVALGTTGNYSIQYIAIQMSSSTSAG